MENAGFPCIPKDSSIDTDNAKAKNAEFDKHMSLAFNSDNLLNQELIPFSIPTQNAIKEVRNAKHSKEDEVLLGKCLLDTGAKGSSFMSDDFATRILKRNNRHTVSAK